jgi:hypothetical protein
VAFLELAMPRDDQASQRQLNWPKNSSTWGRFYESASAVNYKQKLTSVTQVGKIF